MERGMKKINYDIQRNKRAILSVIGSAGAIFFPGSLVFGFPGLMGPVWQEILAIEPGALSYLMFSMLASLGVFMFFVGKWTASVGARKLMIIGTIATSLATLMVAFVSSVWMIYVWAFMVGGASCFIYSPGINSVQRWFPAKRGLVSGIVNLTFGISAAIMVPVFRILLEEIGYQNLCLMVAAITLVVGLIASQFTEIPEKVKGMEPNTSKQINSSAVVQEIALTAEEAVKTKSFWLLWSVWALMGAAGVTMVVLSVRYGLSMGFGFAEAAAILTAYNLANGISRLVTGAVSDIIGRNLTLAATFVMAGLAYFLLPQVSSLVMISVLAACIGFGYGTLFACSSPMIADCFGLKNFGVILGLVFTAYGFLAGIIGPAASGYILEATGGNYNIVFYYLGTFCIISAGLIMLVSNPKKA
jgi:MFS transporter, OFA family, oxalate/formate antiporter